MGDFCTIIIQLQQKAYYSLLARKLRREPGISEAGCCPGAVDFFGSDNCFNVFKHMPYVLVVQIENKIHIVKILCWQQCLLGSKDLQNQTLKKFNRREGRGDHRSWFRLCLLILMATILMLILIEIGTMMHTHLIGVRKCVLNQKK